MGPERRIYVHDQSGVDLSSAPHNLFGSTAGETRGIADGFWASVQPLAPGKHELRFSGATPSNSFVVSHIMIVVTHLQSINKTVGNGLLEMSSTSSPSYRCEACGRSFDWLQELEQHKRQEHQK